MRRLSKLIILVLFLSLSFYRGLRVNYSYAEIPRLISYQGRLTDVNGASLNGSYNLTFRIYDSGTAGNLLWEETQTGVVIQKGVFSVLLGSVTNLNLAFDKAYFLEVKVNNEVLSPRQQITSSGYAIRAETAEKALTAQQAQNATSAEKATTADGIRGSENIFVGSGNVGIGTANPESKLDVQGGTIRFKGIRIEYITGSNSNCPTGTGGIIVRKWASQTNSCNPNSGSGPTCCTTSAGWFVNPPTCEYAVVSCNQYGEDCNWKSGIFAVNQWTEAICMGN